MLRRVGLLSLLLALTASCGARTGLEIPDAARDAGLDAGLDAPFDGGRDAGLDAPPPIDACAETIVRLRPNHAEVLFVLDRSTSMGWSLTGPSGVGASRWSILVDALEGQLPAYDATSDMGLLLFPHDAPGAASCDVSTAPQLATARDHARAMLDLVRASGPGGRTPTADTLESARAYFLANPDPGRVRAVVLATDGAPNCNGTLDAARCPCTGGGGLPSGGCSDPQLCLDDRRTFDAVAGLAGDGVPTYVIGIDGDPDRGLIAVLTQMARLGGRPNPLDPGRGFYSIQRPEDLAAAFERIQASIVGCSFALDGPAPSGRGLALTLDGTVVPEDGVDGWGWSTDAPNTVLLFGEACRVAQDGPHRIELTVLCGL